MKALKKLNLSAQPMSHAEMKNIKGSSSYSANESKCSAECRLGNTITITCDVKCTGADYNPTSMMYGYVQCLNNNGDIIKHEQCLS